MLTQVRWLAALVAIWAASPALAAPIAQNPTISGNIWVAIAIVGVLIAIIFLIALGSFGLEKRDAKLGRRKDDDGSGWGLF